MKKFEVVVQIELVISGQIEVEAKSEQAAEDKVDKMIREGHFDIRWELIKDNPNIELDEQSQEIEISEVNEIEE